jgi:hypothetical protein
MKYLVANVEIEFTGETRKINGTFDLSFEQFLLRLLLQLGL